MSFFIFNDVSSVDLGLYIKNPIIRPTWSELYDTNSVPGRAVSHRRPTGNYSDATMSIDTFLMEDATPARMKEIYSKLNGEGIMVIGNDIADMDDEEKKPKEYLNVKLRTIVPQAVAMMAAEIPLTADVFPFAYAIEPDITDFTNNIYVSDSQQNPTTIYNNESIFFEPVIEYVLATSEDEVVIDVGGSWFHVKTPDVIKDAVDPSEYTIVIDSENRICYYIRPDGIKVSCTQNTSGTFPTIRVGASELMHTKTLLRAEINHRNRWL